MIKKKRERKKEDGEERAKTRKKKGERMKYELCCENCALYIIP